MLKFPDLASLKAHIAPPLRSSDTERADVGRCTGEPGLAASAFSFVRFEFDTCDDNSGPRIDPVTGKKNCGNPGTSTCYAHCSDDGHCATFQSTTPCSSPTATPPTGNCPWPPPAPCCTPEPFIVGSQQFCSWNCTADYCDADTVFSDGCVKVNAPVAECPQEGYEYDAQRYGGACCPATPTPTPTGGGGVGCTFNELGESGDFTCGHCWDSWDNDCDGDKDFDDFDCINCYPSPIVIDVLGDGFSLSDAAGGVLFDISGTGHPVHLGWTAGDDAWLALDRDGDGIIGSGRELFGNYTPQPEPPQGEQRNGFLVLAEFDKHANGGNADGVIDGRDSVFTSLRLWQDANRNGVSESGELHALPELGLRMIELSYKESKRTDRHGNRFRYRAKVRDVHGAQLGVGLGTCSSSSAGK